MTPDIYREAERFVVAEGEVSTSALRDRFGLSYVQAVRLIDRLEEGGVVGVPLGPGPRPVIKLAIQRSMF